MASYSLQNYYFDANNFRKFTAQREIPMVYIHIPLTMYKVFMDIPNKHTYMSYIPFTPKTN